MDLEAIRARVHNLSDVVQGHEIRLAEDKVLIRSVTERLDGVVRAMATGEQLRAAEINLALQLTNTKNQLDSVVALMKEQIQNIRDDIAPIQRGIYWIVTLVLGAVVVAVLALVLKGGR